ncbi:hypothetical protein K469DRAFT_690466 [Zopfia rhizophila CBS 207.26]|uniref:Ell binding protein Ebp1 C-terminal domain-containing protein n=1 Tax=Zopfia rhizophila CBS 207.26 TaxID=1314779 RepID=A0A6A6DYK2_9PEZI|nr:hypothetical protein K469DRAFT_690466 [Zopfia rhizophila CBS 207.26]
MSIPEPAPDPAKPGSKAHSRSAKEQEELHKLDAICDRIKRAVPEAPYILSVPSLHPYQHWSRQEAQSWMMGHLFERHEEHLQYRTFQYREPYMDCFVLQPGEEDIPQTEKPKPQTLNTPSQGPKKKISLSAYKSKQANGVITPGSKKPSPNLAPRKPDQAQVNGVKESAKAASPPPKSKEPQSQKRASASVQATGNQPAASQEWEERPAKKPRKEVSPDPKPSLEESPPSNSTPHGLPPLLSPVGASIPQPYDLPPILSPTLPSNIQAELDRLETQRKRAESNASTLSSDRKSQLLPVPDARSQKRDEGAKTNSRIRSVSVNDKSPGSVLSSRIQSSGPSLCRGEPSLIVRLKYTKKIGSTIQQLLRLPPTWKAPTAIEKKERQGTTKERSVKTQTKAFDGAASKSKENAKAISRRTDTSTPTANANSNMAGRGQEKRPLGEDDASLIIPSKRPKTQQDGPSTPSQQTVSSPALSNKSSAQKSQSQYITPRKDLKAINMIRTNSAEGYDSTPGRSGATPSGSKHVDGKVAPTSTPVNGKKHADIQTCQQTSMKLNTLGRSLKHEAQKFVDKGGQMSKEDHKRAAVTSVECILSYMAAYHVQDISLNLRGRPGEVENTWKTLLPLCMSYMVRTKDFPHLEGLRLYLSAVISASICGLVALRSRARAHDSPHDTPHPEPAPNLHLLSDHYIKLLRSSQDAKLALSPDDIQNLYPKTYAGREAVAKPTKELGKLSCGNLTGPYFLPLGIETTPIQAVRFGLKFLSEYCEKEGLGYAIRVSLEKPE